MTPFVKRMSELLGVILNAPEQWEREKAKHDMAELLRSLNGGQREASGFTPIGRRDPKMAQANDDAS